MIDIEKFICSLMEQDKGAMHFGNIALKKQGFKYKDGAIVEIEPKHEAKFKVGDWVMLDRPVLITKVEDMPYNTHQYWTSDGTWFGDATKVKLWTIQDAKDGDVLVDGDAMILFKSIGNEYCNNVIDYYAYASGVSGDVVVQKGGHYWGDTQDCTLAPATKEQRKGFFAAMHDAGYEWDAEHKQLKKVEPKKEPTEFEKGVKATLEQLHGYPVTDESVALYAAQLLLVAKKQLQEEFDKQLEQAYKNADKVQYERGYRKAIEDARNWLAWYTGDREVTLASFDAEMEQKLKELSQG